MLTLRLKTKERVHFPSGNAKSRTPTGAIWNFYRLGGLSECGLARTYFIYRVKRVPRFTEAMIFHAHLCRAQIASIANVESRVSSTRAPRKYRVGNIGEKESPQSGESAERNPLSRALASSFLDDLYVLANCPPTDERPPFQARAYYARISETYIRRLICTLHSLISTTCYLSSFPDD